MYHLLKHGDGHYSYFPPRFFGSWENSVGAGVKKNPEEKV